MNIAVVDDLAVGRETLVNYLNEYFSERNMNVTISDFSDAESFVTQFENNKYNMIYRLVDNEGREETLFYRSEEHTSELQSHA